MLTALAGILTGILAGILGLLAGLLAAALLLTGFRLALVRVLRILAHMRTPMGPAPLDNVPMTRSFRTCEGTKAGWSRGQKRGTPIFSQQPTTTGSDAFVGTVVVHECRAGRAHLHGLDRAEDHVVARYRLHLEDAAVERHHGTREHRRAGRERAPRADLEARLLLRAGAAREHVGDRLGVGAERVDAEHAVLAHQRPALAFAVDAHEDRRRCIGHRAHRRRREAGLAGGASRRHHMDGGAEPAHRLAEEHRVDRRDRVRPDRLEGAGHRVVGALVDPAHVDSKDTSKRPTGHG